MLHNLSEDTQQSQNLKPLFHLVYQPAGTQEFWENLRPILKVGMLFVIAVHPKKNGLHQSLAMLLDL